MFEGCGYARRFLTKEGMPVRHYRQNFADLSKKNAKIFEAPSLLGYKVQIQYKGVANLVTKGSNEKAIRIHVRVTFDCTT